MRQVFRVSVFDGSLGLTGVACSLEYFPEPSDDRFFVTANGGAAQFQVAEIQLF